MARAQFTHTMKFQASLEYQGPPAESTETKTQPFTGKIIESTPSTRIIVERIDGSKNAESRYIKGHQTYAPNEWKKFSRIRRNDSQTVELPSENGKDLSLVFSDGNRLTLKDFFTEGGVEHFKNKPPQKAATFNSNAAGVSVQSNSWSK